MFSDLFVSKWELRLWTSFLVHSRWKKDLKIVAFCCYNIVNNIVFVTFHFLDESVFFFVLGWLWGLILGGFGDLWDHFCDLLEVRKTIEILRWILEAKGEKERLRLERMGGVCGPKRRPNRQPEDLD